METIDEIGKQIKLERKKRGLSQEGLAMKAEIDRAYMSSIEQCQRNISIRMLYQITSKGLDMTMVEFFQSMNL